MEEQINIINTKVIPEDWNAFWEDISPLVADMQPQDTLVLSQPFPTGSATENQLQKMLAACQLQPNQYNIIQLTDDQKIAWHQLREWLKPDKVILLGVSTDQLGISIQFMPHQVNRFNDCSWMPTLSIPQLEEYPDIKKHLWNYGLKPVFVDKIYG
jgi:hypothetical protein